MARTAIVDLVVGSALFRDTFVRGGRGHVDLPRLRRTGVRVVGLTVAATWPDLEGSLSRWHFRSLGLPARAVGSPLAIAEWTIGRIGCWCAESGGRLRLIRSAADLEACLAPGGPVGVLIGVQGGHVLEGSAANVTRLRERGVRMFAPAHVMDNALAGSSTGRGRGGLTSFGREVIAELEAQSIIVDVAHMSQTALDQALPRLRRPFVLSHAGLTDVAAARSRWRRYSPATRNVPSSILADMAGAGGLAGITLSTQLLGGRTLDSAVRTIAVALEAAGEDGVALGSDMDGALTMVIDVEGLPALADSLLDHGLTEEAVAGILGANAARFLGAALRH